MSLLGDGSSLAIAGAHTLAANVDSLSAYEQRHRRLVEPRQRRIRLAASYLVPKTRLGLATRNLAARVMR